MHRLPAPEIGPNFAAALVTLAFFAAGCADGSTAASNAAATRVDRETFSFYFSEAEKRANLWFCGERVPGRSCERMPALPPASVLFDWVRFFREPPLGQTCTYDSSDRAIRVPSDKWRSGCVPHELLHAALDMIDDPCWRKIEHGPYRGPC